MRLAALLATLALLAICLQAQPYVVGQTYFGRNNYIEYRAGDLPIILSAAHGGLLTPSEIPNRTYGTFDLDTNTRELAIACYDEIVARTGRRPHLILCHLRRTKLDANREIVEAAQGNVFAEQAWREFHGFIEAARDAARTAHGFGLVIDLHGHGHEIERLELGYALGNDELNVTNAELNNPGYLWMSTLRTLALSRPGVPFSTLVRGTRSLGDILERRGVPAWPSPTFPSPGDAPFFDGGYIVREHSCIQDNQTVHGVQIETHFAGIRDSATSRADFAVRFAHALQPFLWEHYGYDLGTLSLSRFDTPATAVLERGGSPLALTVRRTGWINLSSTLPFTISGTAERGGSGDYQASPTSQVSFSAGGATARITLTPNARGPAFGDRTILLTLAPAPTVTADTTPLLITLNDGISQTVRASLASPQVSESAEAAVFTLTRTQSGTALTVPLSWAGTAQNGLDHEELPASASFAAGASTVSVSVPLVDDGRPEPDRTLTLLPQPGAGYFIGIPASATLTLKDDDRPAGLVAWLRGDLDGNVATDSSGLGNHGTTLPANGDGATGPVQATVSTAGNAPSIVLDGVNDTLALPRLAVDDASGAFTVAFHFRINPAGSVTTSNLLSYGDRSDAGSLHVYLATTNATNGTVALRSNLPGLAASALDVSLTAPQTWLDGAWRHYALTVGANGTARVYVDGILRRTAAGRTGRLAQNELLWLGWRPASGPSTAFLNGALRDLRLYQRQLPAAEVTALALSRVSFASWLGSNGLDAASPHAADTDGDGVPLLLEYGLAGSPIIAATPPRLATAASADRLTLRFVREIEASDVTWSVEGSADLATWQQLARRSASEMAWTLVDPGVTITDAAGLVVVTDSASLPLSPRRFLRVRVTTP